MTGMVDFADAAIECGEPSYAAPLFERLEPWAGQLPVTGASALGPVSHYLGGLATVLGRLDEADAYFAHAAAMSEGMGAKFFGAGPTCCGAGCSSVATRMATRREVKPSSWPRATRR